MIVLEGEWVQTSVVEMLARDETRCKQIRSREKSSLSLGLSTGVVEPLEEGLRVLRLDKKERKGKSVSLVWFRGP